jgi:hypothetical protein
MKFVGFVIGIAIIYYLSVITSGWILDQTNFHRPRTNDKIMMIPGLNIVYAFIVLFISIIKDIIRDQKEVWKKNGN